VLCRAPLGSELRPLAMRMLSTVRQDHPSFFYNPVLAGIKSASPAGARHGMLRLALMLQLLQPAAVLPRELVAAALNQTCTLV
jgi:hypothetical protein